MEQESLQVIAEAAKYLSIGLIGFGLVKVATGISAIFETIISCISRNPEVKKDVSVFAWVGAGMTEAIALFALALAIMLIYAA